MQREIEKQAKEIKSYKAIEGKFCQFNARLNGLQEDNCYADFDQQLSEIADK